MMRERPIRARFWIESALAASTCGLALVTLISRDWVEFVFGVDPDHGNGSFEWFLVGGLLVITLALVFTARAEWRRPVRA
jgi:hypothetical protein